MKRRSILCLLGWSLVAAAVLRGADNTFSSSLRRVPPAGLAIATSHRAGLEEGVVRLGKEIAEMRSTLKDKPALLELLPDVQIYHKAVQWPLIFDERWQLPKFRAVNH